ncbi:MAG: hypothetical protein AAFU53_08785 [Cyanobacteria bacterium J06632_3]
MTISSPSVTGKDEIAFRARRSKDRIGATEDDTTVGQLSASLVISTVRSL